MHSSHPQVVYHAFDLGIADVGTINMAYEIQQRQHWYQSQINLVVKLVLGETLWRDLSSYLAGDSLPLLFSVVTVEGRIFGIQS